MNQRHRTLAASLAGLLTMAGCSVAPVYERPAAPMPAAYKQTIPASEAGTWKTAEPSDALARGRWWTVFGDPRLDALETEAAQANQSLKAGLARLEQARALARASETDRVPRIDAGAGPTRSRPSPASVGLPAGADTSPQTLNRAVLTASYEADLFGRVASTIDAAHADAEQAQALYHALLLAIQADVAQLYFTLRSLDTERALLDETVRLRESALQLVDRRYEAGETSELDVARARTELSVTRAEAIATERQRAQVEHALAVLLGKAPAELSIPPEPLAFEPVAIPAGLPSALLERRPDIAAAERAMAGANARIGIARAASFPSLTLTGALGFESADIGDLFRWSSRTWLLGPLVGTMLSLPVIDGGRNKALAAAADARYDEAVAQYREAVLVGFRDTEDSLAALRTLAQQAREQARSVQAAQHAASLSDTRYRSGFVSYLEVIDAERSLLAIQRAAAQVERDRALATVGLIRALGGGWSGVSSTASAPARSEVPGQAG